MKMLLGIISSFSLLLSSLVYLNGHGDEAFYLMGLAIVAGIREGTTE